MKIGKFAVDNKVSIDTIRHYMDLGLIIPEKQGGQYNFDDRCKKDLEDILSFKEMDFSLNEIKSIFLFKRLGKLTPYQEDEYYKEFFTNKLKNINDEISRLFNIKTKLEYKIENFKLKKHEDKFDIGIDISLLKILRCPKCQEGLMISDGNITNNQIINGKLKCKCEEEYIIEDGILVIDDKFKDDEKGFQCESLMEYINATSLEYQENMHKGLEWTYKKLNFKDFKDKIILELGSGVGLFLRNIYNDLPDDSLYIAVDHDVRKLKFLKNMIEKSEKKKNIVFICCDFLKIPIEDRSIDYLIDFSGTSNYNFEHSEFLLSEVDKYIKEDASLIGGYIVFKNFSNNSLIGKEFRRNFILNNIKSEIKKLTYKEVAEFLSNSIDEGGKYESFFTKGEKICFYMFYGKR